MSRILYPSDDIAAQRMRHVLDIGSYSMGLFLSDLILFVLKMPCRMAVPALIAWELLVGHLVGLTPETVSYHWLAVPVRWW